MRKTVVWLPAAQNDLQSLRDYYAPRAGTATVAKIVQHIVQSANRLTDQPNLGAVSSSDDDVREWHLTRYPYTLPYIVQDDYIIILRVFHQSQKRPSRWETE